MWMIQGQPKIVLKVSSLNEMLALEQYASKISKSTHVVEDAGRTSN